MDSNAVLEKIHKLWSQTMF